MKDTGSQARRPEADLDMLDRSDPVGEGIAAAMADPGDEVSRTAGGPGPSSTQPPAADGGEAANAPDADADTEPTDAEPTDTERTDTERTDTEPTDTEPTDAVPPQKPRAKAKTADTAAQKQAGTRPKSNPWAAPQPGQQSGRPTTRQRPTTPRDRTPGSGTPRRTDPTQRPPRATPKGSASSGTATATPADPRGREVAWYAIGSAVCLVAGYALGRYENRVVMTLTGAGCGLLLGLWAVARGTWINAKAGPDSKRAPAALGAIAGGLLVALLSMMLVVTSAIIYPERRAYETCMSGANTLMAQQICTDQYDHSLRERGLPGAASIGP